MVIVNPDQIAILDILGDCLGEDHVDLGVGLPRAFIEGDLTRVVVK